VDDESRRSATENDKGSPVQNHFLIETEVAHRRGELKRALMAADQRAQARPQNGPTRWSQLAALTRAYLRSLATPRVPVLSWNPAGVQSAQTLEGGRATAT
jgi:hypothetical protein